MKENSTAENNKAKIDIKKGSIWKIFEFFKEDNGKFSAIRLALIIWTLGVFVVIVHSIWINQDISNSPSFDTMITIMAMLMGGKVIQKFGEEKNNK